MITNQELNNLISNLEQLGYLPRSDYFRRWRTGPSNSIELTLPNGDIAKYHLQFLFFPKNGIYGIWDRNVIGGKLIEIPEFEMSSFTVKPEVFAPTKTVAFQDIVNLMEKMKKAGYIKKYTYGIDGVAVDANAEANNTFYYRSGITLVPVKNESGQIIDAANADLYDSYDITPYLFGRGVIYDNKTRQYIAIDDAKLAAADTNITPAQLEDALNKQWWKNPVVYTIGGLLVVLIIAYLFKLFTSNK